MNAKELMIGDWVRVETAPSVFCLCKMTPRLFIGAFKFEPIPLTPEIVEANGFKLNIFKWWQHDRYAVALSEYDDTFFIWERIPIVYVHELQHALRLCGLTDLADNFKI